MTVEIFDNVLENHVYKALKGGGRNEFVDEEAHQRKQEQQQQQQDWEDQLDAVGASADRSELFILLAQAPDPLSECAKNLRNELSAPMTNPWSVRS